jgi:hypothetical protein
MKPCRIRSHSKDDPSARESEAPVEPPCLRAFVPSCLCACVTVFTLIGCQTPPKFDPRSASILGGGNDRVTPPAPIEADQVGTRDDIVSIYQFWKPLPWRMADDRAVGFSVPTYFISAETQKGVFVSGKILAWLYEVNRLPDGSADKQCVHIWEFDRAAALGYRVRKRAVMDYFYGFALTWPPNLELAGREVEIVFGYERADGQVITSTPRRDRVPSPAAALAGRPRALAPRAAAPRPAADREVTVSPEMRERVRTRLRDLSRPGAAPRDAAAPPGTDD